MARFSSIFTGWLVTLSAVVLLPVLARAIPVSVTHSDSLSCDPLAVPSLVEELGAFFPPDERINPFDRAILTTPVCSTVSDDPALRTFRAGMTNLTTRDFSEVWYVSDPETSLANVDGFVNGEEAFRIDTIGVNRPLAFESISADGIFQAGETWHFDVQDYVNVAGINVGRINSAGLVGTLSGGDPVDSSGSIIALPEPATGLLLIAGLAGLATLRGRPTV